MASFNRYSVKQRAEGRADLRSYLPNQRLMEDFAAPSTAARKWQLGDWFKCGLGLVPGYDCRGIKRILTK
jgi:hypothetical protein